MYMYIDTYIYVLIFLFRWFGPRPPPSPMVFPPPRGVEVVVLKWGGAECKRTTMYISKDPPTQT